MKSLAILLGLCTVLVSGCASHGGQFFPLEGTDTAVVRISVDKETGKPKVSEETIVVKRGQRVVLVGPAKFEIDFPKGTPFDKSKFATEDAVINLIVPRRKDGQQKASGKKTKFKYDVIVNGVVLDPHMVIIEL